MIFLEHPVTARVKYVLNILSNEVNMSYIEDNESAVYDYLGTKYKRLEVNNGNTKMFKADVSYNNLKTGGIIIKHDAQISVSMNYPYGGYVISLLDLEDSNSCFIQHSTNYNSFSYTHGQLTIIGKDNNANKGDYILVLS